MMDEKKRPVALIYQTIGYFVTKIFHPNVAPNGEICVNTLKKDWKSTLGIAHILLVSWRWVNGGSVTDVP